jgi:hypothetical protein
MSTTATTKRAPLALAKGVKNTLDGSTIVQAKGSVQRHVLAAGSETTLCRINTAKWSAKAEVADDATVSCPLCADALKAEAKKAKDAAKAEAES